MKSLRITTLVLLFALGPSLAHCRTWYVKLDGTGDAPTIQAGIDSAQDGDDVLVAAGVYTWTNQGAAGMYLISVGNKNIWLHSESGPEVTVLDAEYEERVLCVWSDSVSAGGRIEGFTITGGWGDHPWDGGGLVCGVDATITNNIVTGNGTMNRGAGISCFECSPNITNNTIVDNWAIATGAGVLCYYSDANIISNIITNNSAPAAGGIYCYFSSPTITCNDFWDNEGGDSNCTLGADNFSADPMFCDPAAGDYYLHEDSPCAARNSSSGCGSVGALPVGCWGVGLGPGAVALITMGLGAGGAWRVARNKISQRVNRECARYCVLTSREPDGSSPSRSLQ